jgi:hypothetical protein
MSLETVGISLMTLGFATAFAVVALYIIEYTGID